MNELTYVIIIGILCFACGLNTGVLLMLLIRHEKGNKQ